MRIYDWAFKMPIEESSSEALALARDWFPDGDDDLIVYLAKKLTPLLLDKKRLDWLEKNHFYNQPSYGYYESRIHFALRGGVADDGTGKRLTLREAIDSATEAKR